MDKIRQFWNREYDYRLWLPVGWRMVTVCFHVHVGQCITAAAFCVAALSTLLVL